MILFDFRQAAGDDLAAAAHQRADLRQRIACGAIEQPRQGFARYAEQRSRRLDPRRHRNELDFHRRRGQSHGGGKTGAHHQRALELAPAALGKERIETGGLRERQHAKDRRQARSLVEVGAVRQLPFERQRRPVRRVDATQTLGRPGAMAEQPAVVEQRLECAGGIERHLLETARLRVLVRGRTAAHPAIRCQSASISSVYPPATRSSAITPIP